MSIWEALGTFGFFGFIFVVLAICAPVLLIWQAHTIFKTMKSKIEKHGSYLVVGLIVSFIIGLYLKTAGKPETSTQFYEFGSYFGGIGAGLGVLIAGLGYLQSARSEKRALEKELIDDNLKSNTALINMYERNIELKLEFFIKRNFKLKRLINELDDKIEKSNQELVITSKELEDVLIGLEKAEETNLKEKHLKRMGELKASVESYKGKTIEIESQQKALREEYIELPKQLKEQADIINKRIKRIQLSLSTPLTELLFEQTKLEANYKINKILADFEDIDFNAKA